MAFCTNCGNQMADGVKFCTSCGTAVAAAPAPAATAAITEPAAPPVQPQPVYTQAAPQPAATYQEEPISTGSYIGIFLLLMLPIVNLVCLIIWACGGCAKRNKANMARALLVWMLIGTVLGGLVLLAGSLLFGDTLDSIREIGSQINAATGE